MPTEIYFNGALDFCLIQNIFFDQATGGSKCSNSPLESSKVYIKKIFRTEIDFDVGSRLPLGAAIQNISKYESISEWFKIH